MLFIWPFPIDPQLIYNLLFDFKAAGCFISVVAILIMKLFCRFPWQVNWYQTCFLVFHDVSDTRSWIRWCSAITLACLSHRTPCPWHKVGLWMFSRYRLHIVSLQLLLTEVFISWISVVNFLVTAWYATVLIYTYCLQNGNPFYYHILLLAGLFSFTEWKRSRNHEALTFPFFRNVFKLTLWILKAAL